MSADRATVAIGDQFHLTISAHVDEKIAQLDNLTLPDLAGFDSLGDERRCFAAASGGSDCVETVTLSATIAGPRAIRGATLDAVDARNGKPTRFTSDGTSVYVTGPIAIGFDPLGGAFAGMIFGIVRAATIFTLVVVAAIALVWAFYARRRPAPAVPVTTSYAPPPDPYVRLRELGAVLLREPTRANALRLRAAMREAIGAREDETLDDLVGRNAGTSGERNALRAVERAAFCEDARVESAVSEAEPFLLR